MRRARGGPELARRLCRQQVIVGGYRLDDGALLDDVFHFLPMLGRDQVTLAEKPLCEFYT